MASKQYVKNSQNGPPQQAKQTTILEESLTQRDRKPTAKSPLKRRPKTLTVPSKEMDTILSEGSTRRSVRTIARSAWKGKRRTLLGPLFGKKQKKLREKDLADAQPQKHTNFAEEEDEEREVTSDASVVTILSTFSARCLESERQMAFQSSIESLTPDQRTISHESSSISGSEDAAAVDIDEEDYMDEESDRESSADPDSFKMNILEIPSDYLAKLAEAPSVSNISSTLQDESEQNSVKGYFVDPLTSRIQQKRTSSYINKMVVDSKHSTDTDSTVEEQAEQLKQTKPGEKVNLSELSLQESDDAVWLHFLALDENFDATNEMKIETSYETLFQWNMNEPDKLQLEVARKHKLQMLHFLKHFLLKLADRAVETCANIDGDVVLDKSLSTEKLLEELSNLLVAYTAGKRINKLLTRRVVEYYKRKKEYRSILPLSWHLISMERKNFMEALDKLNQLLYKENRMKIVSAETIAALHVEREAAEELCNEEYRQLQDMMRKIINRDNESWVKLPAAVERHLTAMTTIRNEISKVRLQLFRTQHTLASLNEDIKKLEIIGNGLTLPDYEKLMHQVTAIEKTVNDRNYEMVKQINYCQRLMHMMAHLKEQENMWRLTMQIQLHKYKQHLRRQRIARAKLHDVKLKRRLMRKEIAQLHMEGILIDKPGLLHDYARTIEQNKERYERVSILKNKLAALEKKVLEMEKIQAEQRHSLLL